jgi:hypothetical protein
MELQDTHSHYMFNAQILQTISRSNSSKIIRGLGIIDECKLGKRKYNHGHYVEGVWIVGGAERISEKKIFLCSVHDRNSVTLLDVIVKHVHPGSIIHTDMWAS